MIAIVAAMVGMNRRYAKAALSRHGHAAHTWERALVAAGRAINAASNAAQAGRVVVGAGRVVGGQWWYVASNSVPTRYGGAWVWSTAAHDPRPCAWPRPFARGADR